MEKASGVPSNGYSVTLPPFRNGDPSKDNEKSTPSPELLGLLNVRYILSEYPLDADGLGFISREGSTIVYENEKFRPRAWVEEMSPLHGTSQKPANVESWGPNRIQISAQGPGLLVLSENYYPGWQVYVDGKKNTIFPYAGLLRSVPLSTGQHFIEFVYRPWSVMLGISLSFLGVSLAISFELWNRRGKGSSYASWHN
jgi:hypothetical protein